MYKLMQKYQRKLLAILGVLLMVAFVAMLGYRGPSGPSAGKTVAGHIGSTPIYEMDLRQSRDQWSALSSIPVERGQQRLPLTFAALPMSLYRDIGDHPELFYLLCMDAQRNGIVVSDDQAKEFLVNQLKMPLNSDFILERDGIGAVRSLLMVMQDVQRLGQSVKVSQPVWRRQAAAQYQSVRLNLVEYSVTDEQRQVPVPVPAQLQKQFETYRDVPAGGSGAPDDPLGFGYQIPARVKVQYAVIPHAEVAKSLQNTPETRHDWEVKAAEYWLAHPDEFRNTPATQPATRDSSAATQPASEPTSRSVTAVNTAPAVKPFPEVENQIIDKLMTADVAAKTASIQKDLAARLAADWIAIRRADPAATQPASTRPSEALAQPATRPADSRMTLARLQKIRADILKTTGVAIDLHEINDWHDIGQLGALPGIGQAQTADSDRFPEYALSFTGQPAGISAAPLQVWEPSQALSDAQGNSYVFRLTAAQGAHAPTDIKSVVVQVAVDWNRAQAFELARQAAGKLLDAAKSVGLSQAARTASQHVISTGMFLPGSGRPTPGYALNDAAAQTEFDAAARKLLEQASDSDRHPITLVELPTVGKVVVAELAAEQLAMPEALAQYEVLESELQAVQPRLAEDWFGYAAVVSRLDYRAVPKSAEE